MKNNSIEIHKTDAPRIMVIIVTWNGKDHVLNLLNSLMHITYATGKLDILVVDNASQDNTYEAITQGFPSVTVIRNSENLGGTGGFNTGLARAFQEPEGKYDYIWLLDNDVLVHRDSLAELVRILEQKKDAAIAGSTMMQLDYPWRINEMGSFVDRGTGRLVLNRHLEPVPEWQGKKMDYLLNCNPNLDEKLESCQPVMDVEYVAAASLLIRFNVARKAGLWMDFFIHYDDVEWCLRIADMGWRVVVSARSLVWHLSGIAKVPTWVQYYDNRNMLYTMKRHGADPRQLKKLKRRVAMKGVYYTVIGKGDIGRLHFEGLEDFERDITGKKDIQLDCQPTGNDQLFEILMEPDIKRILISSAVNLQATGVQEQFVRAQMQRKDLTVDFIFQKGEVPPFFLPNPRMTGLSKLRPLRYFYCLRKIKSYDLVFQSDYRPLFLMSLMGNEVIFINDFSFARRPGPELKKIFKKAKKGLSLKYWW
ncbi:MAG: glycosyltransferase family 2 protein [Desulfonatronovibrio sp.]